MNGRRYRAGPSLFAESAVRPLPFLLLLAAAAPASGQSDPVAVLPGSAVERITADLRRLASEEFQGRGPGTEGIDLAADYIRDGFREAGLTSGTADESYFQPFNISMGSDVDAAGTRLVLYGSDGGKRPLTLGSEFQPLTYGGGGAVGAELVFAGYGITAPDLGYDDYAGLDVTGKVAVVLRREPRRDDPGSPFNGAKTSRFSYIRSKLQAARDAGAGALLLVNDRDTVRRRRRRVERSGSLRRHGVRVAVRSDHPVPRRPTLRRPAAGDDQRAGTGVAGRRREDDRRRARPRRRAAGLHRGPRFSVRAAGRRG